MGKLSRARLAGLLMVVAAVVGVIATPTVESSTCNCSANGECSYGTGCYSDGSCHPLGTHQVCRATWSWVTQNYTVCAWAGDTSCP